MLIEFYLNLNKHYCLIDKLLLGLILHTGDSNPSYKKTSHDFPLSISLIIKVYPLSPK